MAPGREYLTAREHRPEWMRVDRLMGEHVIKQDNAAGREEFERQMERRRREQTDGREWKPLQRGWFLGSEEFKVKLLEGMERRLASTTPGSCATRVPKPKPSGSSRRS